MRIKRRLLDFGIVGIINTVIDFAILNIATVFFGVPRIPANIVSTTVAMVFSFFANKRVVFESHGAAKTKEILLFFVVTVFGLYVIQIAIIYLLTEQTTTLFSIVDATLRLLRLDAYITTEFAVTNSAKIIATIASMTWNYVLYQRVVFVQSHAAVASEGSDGP